MNIISNINDAEKKRRTIALGNFDGLHIGHRRVIRSAVDTPDGGCVTVMHFVPHPYTYFTGKPARCIMQEDILFRELAGAGVDEIIVIPFGDVAGMTPEEFVRTLLLERLGAVSVCCGYNYTFGRSASGDPEVLRELCGEYGVNVHVSECAAYGGQPVSSTRIRSCIESGDVVSAEAMLGRPFSFKFEVVHGDRRGRLLGSPTINQEFPDDFVKPRYGVYASASFVDGRWRPSVTNFGIRPTVELPVPRAETYILGLDDDLYGQYIEVALLRFTRGEMRFNSLDELSRQIASDALAASRIFAEREPLGL